MRIVCYGAVDPEVPWLFRYVGHTCRLTDRQTHHRACNSTYGLVNLWERFLVRRGRVVQLRILDEMYVYDRKAEMPRILAWENECIEEIAMRHGGLLNGTIAARNLGRAKLKEYRDALARFHVEQTQDSRAVVSAIEHQIPFAYRVCSVGNLI